MLDLRIQLCTLDISALMGILAFVILKCHVVNTLLRNVVIYELFFIFQIIFAWVKRFSELFDGSTNDADMRLSLALAIKANKVSLFCNHQDNKTTAIEGIMPSSQFSILVDII